jgi:hypothetical protein
VRASYRKPGRRRRRKRAEQTAFFCRPWCFSLLIVGRCKTLCRSAMPRSNQSTDGLGNSMGRATAATERPARY